MRPARLAPLTGVAAGLLGLLAIATAGSGRPSSGAPGSSVISFYATHGSRQHASDVLAIGALVFLVLFAAVLAAQLAAAPRALPLLILASAVIAALGGMIVFSLDYGLTDVAGNLPDYEAQGLNSVVNLLFVPLLIGTAMLALSCGMAIVRAPVVPRWLGWGAIAIGVLGCTPAFFAALIALLVWVMAVGTLLFASPPVTRQDAAPAGA